MYIDIFKSINKLIFKLIKKKAYIVITKINLIKNFRKNTRIIIACYFKRDNTIVFCKYLIDIYIIIIRCSNIENIVVLIIDIIKDFCKLAKMF